ncbi:MAG TPA: response regulator transcription factor [Dehalococcoidia bacterium]|nr:response regulator transcription factor [Dehalococcoidia bacterium]
MREKILLVDDDSEFLGLAQTWLQNAGYRVMTAENGKVGLRRVFSGRPHLVVLDGNMPRMNGWEVCHRIRDMSDIPVIMVTVNGETSDRLRGFDLGADDYMTKPIDFPELVARIGAILRRCSIEIHEEEPESFRDGEVEIDWRGHQVYVRGELVKLSPTEFKLLACLVKNRGWIVTHEQLLQKVWGSNYVGDKSFVKLYVRYLRQKIEEDPQNPRLILTERGVGYRFVSRDRQDVANESEDIDEPRAISW